jgi:multiple sugar transport system substrate-binding protein
MITRRQLVGRALMVTGALALSACAPASSPAAPAAAPPTGAPPTTAPSASGGATPGSTGSGGSYKLDLGGYRGPAPTTQTVQLRLTRQSYPPAVEQWWKDMYAEWASAYPNITVQEETVPYGDLQQKLQTYVAAGDVPDLMMGRGDFVQAYVFNSLVTDLSQYLNDDFIADITPAVRSQQTVDGKLYAWPWETNNSILYFNKDIWGPTGVPMPPETTDINAGWTWEQFGDAWGQLAQKLNTAATANVYPLAASEYGNGGPGSNYWYESIYIRSNGDPKAAQDSSLYKTYAGVSPDGVKATGYVDTPEAIKGMTFYQNLFSNKLTPSVAQARMFEDGKAATRFAGLGSFLRWTNPDTLLTFKWGATPTPRGNIVVTSTTGDSPIVMAKAKHPVEAAALMTFATNDKNRLTWHKIWGNPPARTSLFTKMGYSDPILQLSVNSINETGYPPPITPGYLEYFSAMNTAVKDIGLGAPVEARLHQVATEIDGLLAPYKRS